MTEYADGTSITREGPWQIATKARAICPDGVVRTVRITGEPDTFFSQPGSVQVNGRTVTGFITVSTRSGSDVLTDDDPAVVKFHANKYGKNGDAFEEDK